MKTYRNPTIATATQWSPCGVPQTVSRLESVSGIHSYTFPVQLTLKGETTRKGIRRVVLSAGTSIPGTALNDMVSGINVDPKGTTPVSVHVVWQGPHLAFMAENGEQSNTGFLGLLLDRLTTDLVAVATDETVSMNADSRSLDGLIAKALCGAVELDLVSGSYGTVAS